MSLFDENLIEVKLYYTFFKKGNTKILSVLTDEKAEKMLTPKEKKVGDDEELQSKEKEVVESVTTKWSTMNWNEQNTVVEHAYNKTNGVTGEKVFDNVAYRDAIIKSCLKSWDILASDGQPVGVTPEAINKLPGDIVMGLYNKYEKLLYHSEEEMGN